MQSAPVKRASCDACRLRKIRCSRTTSVNDSPACEACSRASEVCTFRLPVKRRGPKPKSFSRFHVPLAPAPRSQIESAASSRQDDGKQQSPIAASHPQRPSIHDLCSPHIFQKIMQDYLDRLLVLVPIVHGPTFKSDLKDHREDRDPVFLALVCCISALVVATIPLKCEEYRRLDPAFPYSTSEDMLHAVKSLVQRIQTPTYYNNLTLEKWAVAYTLGLAMVQLGYLLEGKKFHAEANMITNEMGMNHITTYHSLDHVEAQLRKKAFWMNLSSQSHLRLHQVTWDSLSDRFAFQGCDAAQLFPLELDDEDIHASGVQKPTVLGTPLTAGFTASLRIHTCLSAIIEEPIPTLMTWSENEHLHKRVIGRCQCGHRISPTSAVELLRYRLHKLQSHLDALPLELCLPQQTHPEESANDGDAEGARRLQYESMAANIHVTNIWAQSMLLESIIALSSSSQTAPGTAEDEAQDTWRKREEICRQLLNAITRFSAASLESNGMILLFKVRQVAAVLTEYPFGEDNRSSYLAEMYTKAFAERLEELFATSKRPRQMGGMNELVRYREAAQSSSPGSLPT